MDDTCAPVDVVGPDAADVALGPMLKNSFYCN